MFDRGLPGDPRLDSSVEAFTSGDGTNIAVEVQGNGPPLVMVHGSTGQSNFWGSDILPELRRHFTVFAMDRRRRGESADATEYALDREYDDVACVVRAAGSGVSILGHSFGALCAIEAALITDNLHRIVLYEPPFSVDGKPMYPPRLRTRLEERLEAGDREGVLKAFFLEAAGAPGGEIEDLQADPSWDARVASVHTAVRELAVEGYRFDPGRFQHLNVPVLLLVGEHSLGMLTAPSNALANALPNSRVLVLEGQGHAAMATAPKLFLDAVIDYLSY